jgi:uncharacterized protein YciW
VEQLLQEAEEQWERLQGEFEQETNLSARQQAAQERAARERVERLKQAQQHVKQVAEQREPRKKEDGQHGPEALLGPSASFAKKPAAQ